MEAEAELVAFNVCRELKSSRLQGGGGVGTGQETPAGRDGTMSGDTPRGRRHNLGQAGTGGLRAGATGAGVLALPWLGAGGHQQSFFSPLTAPISCFPHPHPRSCSPSLPWGSGAGSVPATGPCPKPQTKGCPRGGAAPGGFFAHVRCWQMTQAGYGCQHKLPVPQLPLPTTHPAPHAAPSERKYKNLSPWDWPAAALQRPFHSPATDTGAAPDVFVSPSPPVRAGSEAAASPAPGSWGQAGAGVPAVRGAAHFWLAILGPGWAQEWHPGSEGCTWTQGLEEDSKG